MIPDREKKVSLFFETSRPAPQFIQSLNRLTLLAFVLEIELLRDEADRSFPSIAEVKNVWSCTSNPLV